MLIHPRLILLSRLLRDITRNRGYDPTSEFTSWDCERLTYMILRAAINHHPHALEGQR